MTNATQLTEEIKALSPAEQLVLAAGLLKEARETSDDARKAQLFSIARTLVRGVEQGIALAQLALGVSAGARKARGG